MRHLAIIFGIALLTACGSVTSPTSDTKTSAETTIIRDTLVMPTQNVPQPYVDTINMGQIIEGETVTARFLVKNPGVKPLVIASTVTGCGCTNLTYNKSPLAPGATTPVTVSFNSKDRFGTQVKTIEIITVDRLTGRLILMCDVIEQ